MRLCSVTWFLVIPSMYVGVGPGSNNPTPVEVILESLSCFCRGVFGCSRCGCGICFGERMGGLSTIAWHFEVEQGSWQCVLKKDAGIRRLSTGRVFPTSCNSK